MRRDEPKWSLRVETPQDVDYYRGVFWRVHQRGGLTAEEYVRAMCRLLLVEVKLQRAAECN
jgi:hypothetical protein